MELNAIIVIDSIIEKRLLRVHLNKIKDGIIVIDLNCPSILN